MISRGKRRHLVKLFRQPIWLYQFYALPTVMEVMPEFDSDMAVVMRSDQGVTIVEAQLYNPESPKRLHYHVFLDPENKLVCVDARISIFCGSTNPGKVTATLESLDRTKVFCPINISVMTWMN